MSKHTPDDDDIIPAPPKPPMAAPKPAAEAAPVYPRWVHRHDKDGNVLEERLVASEAVHKALGAGWD